MFKSPEEQGIVWVTLTLNRDVPGIVISEIEERREFLEAMERLGKASQYEAVIKSQISLVHISLILRPPILKP